MASSKNDFSCEGCEGDALTSPAKDEPSSQLRSKPETPDNSTEQNEEEEKLQLDIANSAKIPSGVKLAPTNPNSEPGYQVPVGTKTTHRFEDPSQTEETKPAPQPYEIMNCPSTATLDTRRLSDKYVRPDEIHRQHLVATNVIDNRSENFYENRGLYGGTGKRPTCIQSKRFYRHSCNLKV